MKTGFWCGLAMVLTSVSAMAQGTPSTLRCNIRGGLAIHGSRQPESAVIARLQCGEPLLVMDTRFGSAHVRNEAGKDGYILDLNFGQWSIEADSAPLTAAIPATVPTTAPQQTASPSAYRPSPAIPSVERSRKDAVRQFEIDWTPSWFRFGDQNLTGSNMALTTNLSDGIGFVADLGAHQRFTVPDLQVFTYRAGPSFSMRRGHVSMTGRILAGGVRIVEGYKLIQRNQTTTYTQTYNGFGGGIGGHVDIALLPWLSLRAVDGEWSPTYADGGWYNGVRVGAGLSFRFGNR